MSEYTTPAVRMRGAAVIITVLATFALTGCGNDESDSATDGNPKVPETAEPNANDSESSDVKENASGSLAGEACLYGNWYLDNESFRALLETAGGTVIDVTGSSVLTYREDGTTTTLYDEWTTKVEQDGSVTTMVRNGEDSGTYEVAGGDTLTMTETDANSVLEMTMKADGQQAVTMTVDPESSPLSQGTFTCEGDTLTVVVDGQASILYREH